MADLKGQQLKDRYQTLLTTSATTANPTTGTLQNGDGSNITELSIGGSLGVTGGANLATSSGNVGIGTASPGTALDVVNAANGIIQVRGGSSTDQGGSFFVRNAANTNTLAAFGDRARAFGGTPEQAVSIFTSSNLPLTFDVNATERMRITPVGVVQPGADNTQTLGSASFRWSEVFAGNATINTSDANEKQDIAELNEAEQQVATALKGMIRKYRWIESVERKGDEARIHVGVIAQDVEQAFEDAGLDPEKYGVFCKDTWYTKEETYTEKVENPDFDEEAEEGEDNLRMIDGEEQTRIVPCESDDPDATEHVRYGVRYDQLWAFIISAL